MKRNVSILFVTVFFSIINLKANDFIALEFRYIGDLFSNFKGGYRQGFGYLGYCLTAINFDTEKARLWKNGNLYFSLAFTHGSQPSTDFLGDIQGASNIEAGNHIYIQELYYEQRFGNSTLSLGLKDICNNYIVTETADLFLNSSFGTPSIISLNFPVSIFPITSPGLELKFNFSENSYFVASIYDGLPYEWEENPYNQKWTISKNDGYIILAEANLNLFSGSTIFKAGYFSKHNNYNDEKFNYGIYFISDIGFRKVMDSYKYYLLLQYGIIPKKNTDYNNYLGLGLKIKTDNLKKNYFGLGLTLTDVKSSKDEYSIELNYRHKLNNYLNIQPSFHYIMNPGKKNDLKNILAAFLRFNLEF